ncbi:hypothetical protein AUJ14_04830 [Candidatus Micrarchaeota archaeon CG1_02_55_22]|nr:MAG: hypothetical protein AUJ14_04830 [Candidatus Micrarchaeota archaeon CG1_02_55_22]
MQRVLMFLSNNYGNDPRVKGIVQTLARTRSVELLCFDRKNVLPKREKNGAVAVENARSPVSGPMGLLHFNLKLLVRGMRKKFDVVHANDFDSLVPAYILSVLRNKPLVYDCHEDYAVFAADNGLGVLAPLIRFLERLAARRASIIYAVNPRLTELGKEKSNAVLLWNARDAKDFSFTTSQRNSFLSRHKLKQNYYCLSGTLCRGRNIKQTLDWFAYNPKKTLVVAGRGELEPLAEHYASRHANIVFLGLLSLRESRLLESNAFALVAVYEPYGNNLAAGPPGKLFDAIASGVPILVGRSGIAETLVEETGCGLAVDSAESGLDSMTPVKRRELAANCVRAREKYSWKRQARVLEQTYPPAF